MINGWYYTIAPYRITDMDGRTYEGAGIKPQMEFTGIPDEGETGNRDIQLERTIKMLLGMLQ
jgi:C-terminal processing protease CtpA/Prc